MLYYKRFLQECEIDVIFLMTFAHLRRPISKNVFILDDFRITSEDSSVQVGNFLVDHSGNLAAGVWIQEGTLQPAGTEANLHQPPFF